MTAPGDLLIDNQRFSKLILVAGLASGSKELFYINKNLHKGNTNEFDSKIFLLQHVRCFVFAKVFAQ